MYSIDWSLKWIMICVKWDVELHSIAWPLTTTSFTDILCLSSVRKSWWHYRTAEIAVWRAVCVSSIWNYGERADDDVRRCVVYWHSADRHQSRPVCNQECLLPSQPTDGLCLIRRRYYLLSITNQRGTCPSRSYLLRVQILLLPLFYCY